MYPKQLFVMQQCLFLFSTILLATGCCCPKSAEIKTQPLNNSWEYATFYAELADDFIAPFSSDAPSRYVWTTSQGMQSAEDMSLLWEHMGLDQNSTTIYSEIEIILINGLAEKGWELIHSDIGVILSTKQSIQSMYRYVFKRPAIHKSE